MIDLDKGTKEDLINIRSNYQLKLNWEDAQYFKLILNKKVVGLIEIDEIDETDGVITFMIYNFEIFNKGQGIGGEFIDEFTKEAKLQVYPLNNMSKKFWEKHGFRIIDDDGLMESM